ncbi:hypothetical protein FQN60_008560 [Etheostoma spectabile]|uniref:Secreted protein n=1 Tax=Etheostoma spectabile TaxID=54343 RepID=A0A5J5CN67_9PERO|nr:hypothetical protein FQN60_008560 [Etheostoma spectabile]
MASLRVMILYTLSLKLLSDVSRRAVSRSSSMLPPSVTSPFIFWSVSLVRSSESRPSSRSFRASSACFSLFSSSTRDSISAWGKQENTQDLGLGLLLVHSELGERLLQRPSLRGVVLALLLQDFSPLLVLPEPGRQTKYPFKHGKDYTP